MGWQAIPDINITTDKRVQATIYIRMFFEYPKIVASSTRCLTINDTEKSVMKIMKIFDPTQPNPTHGLTQPMAMTSIIIHQNATKLTARSTSADLQQQTIVPATQTSLSPLYNTRERVRRQ